jgi:hypothetical protein
LASAVYAGALLLVWVAEAPAQTSAASPAPAASAQPAQPAEAWVFGMPATRVGDARPWLDTYSGGSGFWINPEYLLWWVRKEHLPGPLVTSAESQNSPTAGVPGTPGTTVLFGDNNLGLGTFNGGRLTAGYQSDELPVSFEMSFFAIEDKHVHFSVESNKMGSPFIAIPVNVFGQGPTAVAVSNPGLFSGGVQIDAGSSLWGGEVNCVKHVLVEDKQGLSCLVGLRFLQLSESFHIATSSTDLDTGQTFTAFDSFGTRNNFFGAQAGLAYAVRCDRLCLTLFDKLGLGGNEQRIDISGARSGASTACGCLGASGFLTTPSAVSGIFTSPSNVGSFHRTRISFIDEVGVNGNFELCECVSATAGFSLLYWSNVARPGDQINTIVAPGGVTPPPKAIIPGPLNKDTDFWAYGFNFGLEFRY